ncbi:MAG: GTPase HflX [Acholeplasmataceae bacterium]|jgi:GTP-binding protein HflX
MDVAILGTITKGESLESTKRSLEELKALAKTLEIDGQELVIQSRDTPVPSTYFGSGKVEEIKLIAESINASILIVDDTLSPAQIRNLEKILELQIVDRSFLILQIFSIRAKTNEAILEVRLAQNEYMLPRLVGLGKSLSRQGGGTYNAKGPGETKLELDRRKLLDDIARVKKELAKIRKAKTTSRKRRQKNEIPIVVLVGYTNAGKSATYNSLVSLLDNYNSKLTFEEDMLFATLDTKSKVLKGPNRPPFILIDTVGFIHKLPHELINSFESTLSDIKDADLILHIVDGLNASPEEMNITKEILEKLEASDIERLIVVTKSDLYDKPILIDEDYLSISNKTKENIDLLVSNIYYNIYNDNVIKELYIPFEDGHIVNFLKDNNHVIFINYFDDGVHIKTSLTPREVQKYFKYIK